MSAGGKFLRCAGRRDGFALIAVLWILAALAGLVGAYVAYALTVAQGADFYLRRVEAEAALSGALELAVYDLTRLEPERRPEEGVFDYRIGQMSAQVRYASETLRLDINKASPENLTALLAEVGGSRAGAEKYAQRIAAWREKPGGPNAGLEDLSYRAAGATYMPRHGPFQSVEELADVLDIPPEVVARISPFVTVYGGREKWRKDQDEEKKAEGSPASPADRTAPGQPQAQTEPAQPAAQESSPLSPGGAGGGEQTLKPTRFEIRVIDSQGRVSGAEVVAIAARDGDAPYNILMWRTGDDLSAPPGGRR